MLKNIRASIERYLLSSSYFLLFSVYHVFAMYANNVHGVLLNDLVRPLLISAFIGILFYYLFFWVTKHKHTSALLVAVFYLAFFNYGLAGRVAGLLGIGIRSEIMALAWFLIIVLVFGLVVRNGKKLQGEGSSFALNVMAIVLILFPIIRLMVYSWMLAEPLERTDDQNVRVDVSSDIPDIYYIILDAYTRSDVMEDEFGYDNSAFITALENMGFYVAGCSQSNYSATSMSLASTLNINYLQDVSSVFQPEETDLLHSFKALNDNMIRQILTDAGYKTVVFASGFTWVEWRDADYFLSPKTKGPSEFELMLLFSSYARIVDDLGLINLDDLHAEHYRQRTRFVLDSFDDVLALPSPKFVFVHIIAPHEPYGLDENGNNIAPDNISPKIGYGNQAKFISSALLPQLQELIDGSTTPPVIILQGDHGWLGGNPENLMKILNAYYLPGHDSQLYPAVSPINSFRLVLNSYFDANLPLLEDVSYYSTLSERYDFNIMPNTCE